MPSFIEPEIHENNLIPHQVSMELLEEDGETVVRVRKAPDVLAADQPTYVRLKDIAFHNGVIEVEVKGALLEDAPDHARGFIGVAFRIAPEDEAFESFYIRPTNGRAPVQVRRNRATQYFSYPDFPYEVSRETAPGAYESYVDLVLGEWTHLRIEVEGEQGRFYVHQADQPTLLVNDLKLGPEARGAIGLWVDVGTDGYFRHLRIESWDA